MNTIRKSTNSHKRNELYGKLQLVYWKDEIDNLTHTTGVSINDVCDYLGLKYSRDIAIYTKIPKSASTLIGIGMAYKLPLSEINRWLIEYGKKHSLYAKDVFGDLVWIYLINCNFNDPDRSVNYYSMYDRCREEAVRIYTELYDQDISESADTDDVKAQLLSLPYDPAFEGLKGFIIDNLDAFKTAYAKSRGYLLNYVDCILKARGEKDPKAGKLNSLRGYLDDSMINYLSGGAETIHLLDMSSGVRTGKVKRVPRGRKTHISMCLALGMSAPEINTYLNGMGYGSLDPDNSDERMLLKMLDLWDDGHPLQRRFKETCLSESGKQQEEAMSAEDEFAAVAEMLQLRQNLLSEYRSRGEAFPYLNT
ncbi:MAG: hypothetical protein IJJ03_01965 [Mogibacterium sp.]|nr:hypothetical protein [Mogibacterium sp.]MBQ6501916.1 hypothetical protein [Mogibacterium sp.]